MLCRLWFGCWLALVGLVPVAHAAQKYQLQNPLQINSLHQVQVEVEVGGDLRVLHEGKVQPIKMSVVGNLTYQEKILGGSHTSLAGLRSVRYYDQAKATIKIGKDGVLPTLSEDRRLIVTEAKPTGTSLQMFSPSGPLTRDELDLIDVPANSLLLANMLPSTPVAQGEKWKLSNDLLTALLGLDAIGKGEVDSSITGVTNDEATVEASGVVHGAIGGVATEIEVKTKTLVDLKTRRITRFGMAVKEKRDVGHVAPGLDVVARVRVTLSPLKDSEPLSSKKLQGIPLASNPAVLQMAYVPPAKDLRFYHNRDWFVFHNDGRLLMMRLVQNGELLAQCNMHRLDKSTPGEHPSFENFRDGVQKALGDKFKKFQRASKITHEKGYALYQVIAEGENANLPILWKYYLVADKEGHQIMFTFTLESALADVLTEQDISMLSTFEFLTPPVPATAEVPTPATREKK